MIIERVELKNIKSYKEDTVELAEGIISISGLNGAGKSTILEAVGFALFDSIPYNQAEFVRKGEKTGEVSVTLIGADGLRYTVTRKCGASQAYSLMDSFNNRFEGKDDVGSKLCEILGYKVSSFGQLNSLFENAVGVLQGTFVSEFSKNRSDRKKIFAPLLRVDEYDDAFKHLLTLVNMMDRRISLMNEDIRYKEGIASQLGDLQAEKDSLAKEKERLESDELSKKSELNIVKAKKDGMDRLGDEVKDIEGRLKLVAVGVQNIRAELQRAEQELKKCEAAAQKLVEVEPQYLEYLAKTEEKRGIDIKRDRHNELKISYKMIEARLDAGEKRLIDHKKALSELERYEHEINTLKPNAEEEEQLLKQKEDIASLLRVKENEVSQLVERMGIVKKSKGNVCPLLLDVECTSVTDFSAYFNDHLGRLHSEKLSLEKAQKEVRQRLKALDEPGKRIAVMLESLKKKDKVLSDIIDVESEIERIKKECNEFISSLKQYEGLDDVYHSINKKIDELKPSYEDYQQNIKLAKAKNEWKEAFHNSTKSLNERIKECSTIEETLKIKQQAYDKDLHESIKERYKTLAEDIASIGATLRSNSKSLANVEKKIMDINECLITIEELKSKRDREFEYKAFIELIRDKIRMAGPYIIRVFMDIISKEATEMYSEIAGDRRIEIKWTEDYDIMLIEDGREKVFKQLSGGEQMSAALAVRLAILKVLTNSDLVFLDEPTQNLDEKRRINLAQEIMRIKDFKQMVIISHDDTFNASLENVIEIEKVNGESRVRRRPGHAGPQATLS